MLNGWKERKVTFQTKWCMLGTEISLLTNKNLLVNEDKIENTTAKREEIETEEEWRNVIKLGSKLGDLKDIKRRKELSNNETV